MRYDFQVNGKRESLSVHYRVVSIRDRMGNSIEITYDDLPKLSLRPKFLLAKKSDNSVIENARIDYTYRSDKRLDKISINGYKNNNLSYQIKYADDTTRIATQSSLAEKNAIVNGSGQGVQINSGSPLSVRLPVMATQTSGLFVGGDQFGYLYLNRENLPQLQHALDFYTNDINYEASGYVFEVQDNNNNNYFLRMDVGQSDGLNLLRRVPQLATDPVENYVFADNSFSSSDRDELPVQYKEAMSYQWEPSFNTKIRVQAIGGNPLPPANTSLTLTNIKVYPLIKAGDVVAQGGVRASLAPNWADFNPNSVPVDHSAGLVANQTAYLIREDNFYRIAAIDFPHDTVDPLVPYYKRMELTYDDNALNHQEIKKTELFQVSSSEKKLLSSTEYTYQRLWSSGWVSTFFEGNSSGFSAGGEAGGGFWHPNLAFRQNSTGASFWPQNVVNDLKELDVLRRKVIRIPQNLEGGSTPDLLLETLYGGAYHWAIAGDLMETEYLGPGNYVKKFYGQWVLDAKPFDYTWIIQADGSATVFDLNADGLGLNGLMFSKYSRSQVFKTYQFDTNFKNQFQTKFPKYFGFEPLQNHYPQFQIRFNGFPDSVPSNTDMMAVLGDVSLSQHAGYGSPRLGDLFAATFASKCYSASIQGFEWHPRYKYGSGAMHPFKKPFRRQTVQLLHGQMKYGQVANYPYTNGQWGILAHYRASAIGMFALNPIATPLDAENLINGLSPQQTLEYNFLTLTGISGGPDIGSQPVDWGIGGVPYTGSSHSYKEADLFVKATEIYDLKPAWTMELINYNGFSWHAPSQYYSPGFANWKMGVLDFTGNDVAKLTRFSNGGLVKSVVGLSAPKDASSILMDTESLEVGDTFLHFNLEYTITSFSANSIEISPDLQNTLETSHAIHFIRNYNPSYATGIPVVTNSYRGYDAFGNNTYQEVYLANPGLTFGSDNWRKLVPDFFGTSFPGPDQINWNDSDQVALTGQTNNDLTNWNYFGRVTKSWTADNRGYHSFPDDSIGPLLPPPAGTLDNGVLQTTSYDADFPWLPSIQTKHFPLTIGKPWESTFSIPQSTEDSHTLWTYHNVTNNSRIKGKVASQRTFRGSDPASVPTRATAKNFNYDVHGFLQTQVEAGFFISSGEYGTLTIFTNDSLTGLVEKEQTKVVQPQLVWATALISTSNARNVSAKFNEYDMLGRIRKEVVLDSSGADLLPTDYDLNQNNSKKLGPVTVYRYPNLFSTETYQVTDLVLDYTSPLSLLTASQVGFALNVKDATDRALREYKQYGPGELGSETQWLYETQTGRLSRSFTVARPGTALNLRGYEAPVYNARGEAYGKVTYNGLNAVGSSWSDTRRNGGKTETLSFYQKHGEDIDQATALNGLSLNLQTTDRYGQLEQVEEFSTTNASSLFTAANQPNLAAVWNVTESENPKSKATYLFDRFGQVIQATVGLNNPQVRNFWTDSFGRPRGERHPEFQAGQGAPATEVVYGNFDLYDQAGLVLERPVNGTPNYFDIRTITHTFNAQGNLTRSEFSGPNYAALSQSAVVYHDKVTHSYAFDYQYSSFPGVPLQVKTLYETQDNTNNTVPAYNAAIAYRTYLHLQKGWVIGRKMLYYFDNFASNAAFEVFNAIGPMDSLWTPPPPIAYDYDSIGRLIKLTYPNIAWGTTPTQLEFSYDGTSQQLSKIRDLAFSADVFDQIQYGPGGVITGFRFALAEDGLHSVQESLDGLNRLASQAYRFGSQTVTRSYSYDPVSRIQSLATIGASIAPGKYAYDALGQLVEAEVPTALENPSPSLKIAYTYDAEGLGNLVGRTEGNSSVSMKNVDLTNNQLQGVAYSAFGEQLKFLEGAAPVDSIYHSTGRLARTWDAQLGDWREKNLYDAAGMRVFSYQHMGAETIRTVYAYDLENKVLSELKGEGSLNPVWDRSYLYFDGQSAVTYEADPIIPPNPPPSSNLGNLPPPLLLTDSTLPLSRGQDVPKDIQTPILPQAKLRWVSQGPGVACEMEVAQLVAGAPDTVLSLHGLTGSEIMVELPAEGFYYHRIKRDSGYWSQWKKFRLGDPAYCQSTEAGNLLVIEAEHYASKTSHNGHEWAPTYREGYSMEGAMEAVPNNTTAASPNLNFTVQLKTTGIHYIWIRSWSLSGNDASCHVLLDGELPATANHITQSVQGQWGWTGIRSGGARASLNIGAIGEHMISVRMREDGFIIDKIILTTDPNYTPVDLGPAESGSCQ